MGMMSPMVLEGMDTQKLVQLHTWVTQAMQRRTAAASPAQLQAPMPSAVSGYPAADLSSPWTQAMQGSPVSPKNLAFGDILTDFKEKNPGWDGAANAFPGKIER